MIVLLTHNWVSIRQSGVKWRKSAENGEAGSRDGTGCRQSLAEFVRDNRVRTGAAADYQKEIMKALDGRLPRPPI